MSTIETIITFIKILLLFFLKKKQAKDNIKALKQRKSFTLEFSGYHFKKICREVLKYNYIFIDLLRAIDQNEANEGLEDNSTNYYPPKSDYWTPTPSKDVELYEKPTKRTIDIGFKNRKGFLKKFIKKDKIENYYPATVYLHKTNLKKYLRHIKKIVKVEEKFGQKKLIKNKTTFSLLFSRYPGKEIKVFIFYLTITQIKKLIKMRKRKNWSNGIFIDFSNNQLSKTYKEVIRINSEIYRYLKYKKVDRFYEDNKTSQPKQLAITYPISSNIEILDSLNFQEKDLIDFGDEKDLIDLNTIITTKTPTAQELLTDEELFPKGKKYKVLQDEDLIPTSTTPSTDCVNVLKNILNYPETKRILGVSLTSDLKEKIKNLNSEASFGLANILSSLITANRGKMSIYSMSRNQLKEIIEGFITTLSVLLNPAQKF